VCALTSVGLMRPDEDGLGGGDRYLITSWRARSAPLTVVKRWRDDGFMDGPTGQAFVGRMSQ
jgi:hypothetical protein